MCRNGEETKEHFILDCNKLQDVRETALESIMKCVSDLPTFTTKASMIWYSLLLTVVRYSSEKDMLLNN